MKKYFISFLLLVFVSAGVIPVPGVTLPNTEDDLETINFLLRKIKPGKDNVFIGDMGYKKKYLLERKKALLRPAGKLARPTYGNLWPSGNVPYVFDLSVTEEQKKLFVQAAQEWSRVAKVKFFKRKSSDINYLLIKSANVNNSYVGRQGTGSQVVNIYNWDYKYIICHELGHALGISHEHQRFDRDKYVVINFDNVTAGAEFNFAKNPGIELYRTAYDFDSIMHYGPTAFATGPDLVTIEPQAGFEQAAQNIGQLEKLSPLDASGMNAIYSGRRLLRPQNPLPVDRAVNQSANLTLSWSGVSGATEYRVYFGVYRKLEADEDFGTVTTNDFTVPYELNANTRYYWRVDTTSSSGTVVGETWNFRTK